MKYFQIIIAAMLIFVGNVAIAQKVQTIKFGVGGLCEMCKSRIEKSVDVKGVKFAEYNLADHQIEVTFSPKKISETEIHQLIANIVHDTDKIKASDEAYEGLHHCCKYRDGESH